LYTSAEIQALHNLVKEQEKKIIYNNAVGVPNPDGWELTTDSSDVATWKAYEEVYFSPSVIQRWVREGDEYVNRMTKEQMEALKQQLELAEWIEETDEQVIANAEKRFPFLKKASEK
jgi:DNA polymerase II large subunit